MTTKIFNNIDYIELMLLNYDIYGLDELSYFDLKECTQLVLDEFDCIPTLYNSDKHQQTIKLIAAFTSDRSRQSYRSNCFNFKNHETGDVYKCRFVEPPIKYEDGKLIIFRNKDLKDKFFFGLNFEHITKGSSPHLTPPNFAYFFFHEMHNDKTMKSIDDVMSLASSRYSEYMNTFYKKDI